MDLVKDFSTLFNLSARSVRCQSRRTWQIGLAGSTASLLAVSSLPLEQDFNREPQILACSLLADSSVKLSVFELASTSVLIYIIVGLGSGTNGIASPLLITELAHPNERGKITATYNTFYYFGSTIAAWTTYGTLQIPSNWSWRLPSLLQVAPSAFQLCFLWFLPESPRFLISKDRQDEAMGVMAKYHANGNIHDEVIMFEFAEIKEALKEEKSNSKGRYMDLINTCECFKSMISDYYLFCNSWTPQASLHLSLLRVLLANVWH